MKPIIGIVAKYIEKTDKRQEALIRDELKNAILDNGGIPIGILPAETEVQFTPIGKDNWKPYLSKQQKDNLKQQLALCSGIILQGGKDSLKYESWIAKYCYDNNIPTFGICAGQNAMVRALNGTTKKVNDPEKHSQYWSDIVHEIKIKRDTQLFKIIGNEKLAVNSRHKKVIDFLPKNFTISALDDDGNIEAVEDNTKNFYIALRFHPESLYKKYKIHNKIFKAFIEACKNK